MPCTNFAIPTLGLVLLTGLLCGCSQGAKSVALPGNITTATAGLPFASQIKSGMSKDVPLTTVLVELIQNAGQFQVQQITYGFVLTNGRGRVLAVTVDNTTHQAFEALDDPEIPKNPLLPAKTFQPLELVDVRIEIADVLAIAQTNGLAEFCVLVPGQKANVSLKLGNGGQGIVWGLTGDGWDEEGPIADLSIVIDAKTGNVLNYKLQKGVGR